MDNDEEYDEETGRDKEQIQDGAILTFLHVHWIHCKLYIKHI